jgi:type VI secretion system Hcp family effector
MQPINHCKKRHKMTTWNNSQHGIGKAFLLKLLVLTTAFGQAQQQLSITSSKANNYCNGTCTLFDVADLNNNPTAVMFITPVEVKGVNLDPHPICAYYTGKQWSVMNVDNSTIQPGAQFNVQYYSRPDSNHFVQIVAKENLVKKGSYIDHASLNGNPNAQIQFFQNSAPNARGGTLNKDDVQIQYDASAGKWYIANISGRQLDLGVGYNIAISAIGITNTLIKIINTPVKVIDTPVKIINTAIGSATTTGLNSGPFGPYILMSVQGKLQGAFKGGAASGKIEVTGFEMDVSCLLNQQTGMLSGVRNYSPISIQKASDPASIQFFSAFAANEILNTVTIEFYKAAPKSTELPDYTIKLTSAILSSLKQCLCADQKGPVDSIKMSFQKLELNGGGLSAVYNWGAIN